MQGQCSSEVYRADLFHYTEVSQNSFPEKPPANSNQPPLRAQQQPKQLNKEFLRISTVIMPHINSKHLSRASELKLILAVGQSC